MSGKRFFLFLSFLLNGCLVEAQTSYLFIGSYNGNKDKSGIYIYRFNPHNGKLLPVSTVAGVLNPAFLALSPDGKYLYACTEARTPNEGSVSSFGFNAQHGRASFISKQPSGGENPVYLTVHNSGRWLVNANYTGGSIAAYPLQEGVIAAPAQVIPFTDSSITARQRNAHLHAVVFSPDQRYLFAPDLGADKIRCYYFDTAQQQPLQPSGHAYTKMAPGSGPRHLVFHPNGQFAYCIAEISGTVVAYRYAEGKLDSIQGITAHRKPAADVGSADIHLSPDGRFLYATTRGNENIIVIYAVDKDKGTLKWIGHQSTKGEHPRNFIIDPAGKFLLVANQFSGDVVVFKRNEVTGLLKQTGIRIRMPGPSCLLIREYAL